ncbi:hypothetical protein Hdeb2414_s0008g00291091 [Helianthus debilis subsp. tardiflorus]
MFATRTKIANLKARVEELKKSKSDYKEKYVEAKSHWERVEVLQVELSQQIISKDKDLAGKDVEIAELQRHLREAQENLDAKAETAEEARKVSQAALNVAQDNYTKVQAIVEPLITDLGWLQHYSVVHIANSILNATEFDRAVATLTMASQAAGHCAGYQECVTYVEESLHPQWGTRHCSVNERAEDGFRQAEDNYDNLSLPILDLVKHVDWPTWLKAFFEPHETVQLTDDDDENAGEDEAE